MPELPEVETVRNIIRPLIIDKVIDHVDVFFDRLVISNLNEFKEKIKNKKILSLDRYGKYLFFKLSDDLVMINHLRMEGKWRFCPEKPLRNKYTTALFHFQDGTSLAFDDTRKFGIIYLSTLNEYKKLPMISKLGLEPLSIKESDYHFIEQKLRKNKNIKELLLDQSIFCGIGNIYAIEICYACKISPFKKGKNLTEQEILNIIKYSKIILEEAIQCGGSTIHSFHPSEGVDGRMQNNLHCYGHDGEKCPVCGTVFHKEFLGGRGTTYCPNCQIDYELKKAIGITGPIGAGKSEVLSYLETKGYLTISCDKEVHKLYEIPANSNKISKILGVPFDINDFQLTTNAKKIMIAFPIKKKMVEDYIYPILEKKIVKYIKENEKIAIEVPLLFKAHFEYMFKKIIVLEILKEKQISNLNNRNSNVKLSKSINNDYSYDKNNEDVVIINNNGTIEELYKKIDVAID